MAFNVADRARRTMIGTHTEWVKRFDINEYVQNPPMIEKLYEERQFALAECLELEDQVKELESRFHIMELRNQRLEIELSEARRKSFTMFLLGLAALVLISFGIEIAANMQDRWPGWIMISVAVVLEFVAFLSKPRKG